MTAFRILVGAILIWSCWRYLDGNTISKLYMEPSFNFTYYGFDWVRPWPGNGMVWHFVVMLVLAIMVTVGLAYRFSMGLFWIGFTYVFLLEQAKYLNHYYLVSLITFLMIFMPLHRDLSLDAKFRPALRSNALPKWCLYLMRFQLGLVYFLAGVAKINPDWLRGEPMRSWLAERSSLSLGGGHLKVGLLFEEPWAGYLFSYGGLLLDLFITPLLLWKRTRVPAFVAAVLFHLTNSWIFDIGIFPWFMIAATMIFFEPDWPRRFFNWPLKLGFTVPAVSATQKKVILTCIAAFALIQILVPLRHFLYPGSVHWTEEGHRFAWHMKLRSKAGYVVFQVRDPVSGNSWKEYPHERLTARQRRKMSTRPYMIVQFAHHLAEIYREKGFPNVEVRCQATCSLNGRPYQTLIDPNVDLTKVGRSFAPSPWIVPLRTSLYAQPPPPTEDHQEAPVIAPTPAPMEESEESPVTEDE